MSNYDFASSLDILEVLSETLTVPRTMNDSLEQIAKMTCKLMDTTQAVILLIDEENHQFIVNSVVGLNCEHAKSGQPLDVPERLLNILWRLQNIHEINWVDSGIQDIIFPIIAMPIRFKGKRIGHLITGGARDASTTRDPNRQKVFSLLAPFTSLVIENAKAAELIQQHFAMNSKELMEDALKGASDGVSATDNLLVTRLQNPNKVARLLASSFHRELTNAGFTPENLTVAAAQLLDCVTQDITTQKNLQTSTQEKKP